MITKTIGNFTVQYHDWEYLSDGLDERIYVSYGLGWLELDARGDDIVVVACHKKHPHDGAEVFKMNSETGEIKLWADYQGGE